MVLLVFKKYNFILISLEYIIYILINIFIMKINKCRSCSNKKLKLTFDLGMQKLSGIFPDSYDQRKIPEGSLEMVFCENCKLLQLKNSFEAKVMYGDNYGYMSSLNQSMIEHLKKKAENLKKKVNIRSGDLIVDIGSNDGTFLSFFSNKYNLVGIDPTIIKLGKFYRKDIKKFANFF